MGLAPVVTSPCIREVAQAVMPAVPEDRAPAVPAAPAAHAADVALARRAIARDEAAWRAIYDRTHDRLFALLAWHTGDREEALELLQDVYLHAFRGLGSYRGEGALEGWFAILALRRARDWKRRLLRRRRHVRDDEEIARDLESDAPRGPDPVVQPLGRGLDRALAQLPERQRTAFLLRELEDLSFRDIAQVLGCNEATARVHHLRARRALQDRLSGEGGETGS